MKDSDGTHQTDQRRAGIVPQRDKKSKPVLVDKAKLEENIKSLNLSDAQKNWIKARWLHYVVWWDSRASRAKKSYQRLRGAVVIGGAAIPGLLALSKMTQLGNMTQLVFTVLSIVVSSIVAICAGFESFGGFGNIWREKRDIGELMKSEGFSFFQLSNGYSKKNDHAEAYPLFASKVEGLIRSEIKEYLVAAIPKSGETGTDPDHP